MQTVLLEASLIRGRRTAILSPLLSLLLAIAVQEREATHARETEKEEAMKRLFALLIALLAAIGAATVVLFWRKNHRQSWDSSWSSAKDSASSWGKAAADEAGKTAEKFSSMTADATSAGSSVAEEVKGTVGSSN